MRYKWLATGKVVRAIKWVGWNIPEMEKFTDGKFGTLAKDPSLGIVFGRQHDLESGDMTDQYYYVFQEGNYLVEFTQAGHPIYIPYAEHEMTTKFNRVTEDY